MSATGPERSLVSYSGALCKRQSVDIDNIESAFICSTANVCDNTGNKCSDLNKVAPFASDREMMLTFVTYFYQREIQFMILF